MDIYKAWKKYFVLAKAMVCGTPSPRYGASSGCGWRRRPPDMDGSCKYIQ